MRKLVFSLLALAAVPVHAQDLERWELTAPRVTLRFNAGLMRDIGFSMPAGRPDKDGYVAYEIGVDGRLVADAPGSIFRTVDIGELRFTRAPYLASRRGTIPLRGARLVPGADAGTYTIVGGDGRAIFTADHQHFAVDRKARTLRVFNVDVRLSAETAALIGQPRHEGLSVAVMEMTAAASIPAGSEERPAGGCVTPNWGNPDNDVSLINLSQVSQVDRGVGFVAIAPSAVLRNVGATDVPWISKFSPPAPPYNNDQHPYLVWNMYRLSNGRMEQIGMSGLKHAFLTLNTGGCGCPAGSILWVNCEDTYGVSTNDSTGSLSPRTEINPFTGVWNRCGSIFDPNCDGVQDSVPGFTGASDPRRLAVRESELSVAGAQYFFDGWYVVRDDVNIFNTMAWRSVTPTFGGSTWSFGPFGAQTFGSVLDAWVNPASPGANAESKRMNTGQGLFTIAVRATSVGGGRWRYEYAVHNHDYDARFGSISIPLPAGATVTNTSFHDVDNDGGTDWVTTVTPGSDIRFHPPKSPLTPARFGQPWGTIFNFGFEVNAAPSAPGQKTILVNGSGGRPAQVVPVSILGPQ